MATPTQREMLDHLREHFGLPLSEVLSAMRIPTHPGGLRDEFAGRAMEALIVNPRGFSSAWVCNEKGKRSVSLTAYAQADAMLEVRAKA